MVHAVDVHSRQICICNFVLPLRVLLEHMYQVSWCEMKLLNNMQLPFSDPELFTVKLVKWLNACSVYTVNTPAGIQNKLFVAENILC